MKSLFIIFISALLVASCSSSLENRSSKELLSAFLKDNKETIIFGKIDLKAIVEKADYKSIPKLNVLLIEEMKHYENALELDQGVHFAVQGSLVKANPQVRFLAFAKVRNEDSLASKIGASGLMLTESAGMKFVQDHDVAIAVKDGMAVFMTQEGKYDGKAELKKVLDKCKGDLSGGKIDEILNQKGDIIGGCSFENIFHNSPEWTNTLSGEKKKELNALFSNSYLSTSIGFETGRMIIDSKSMLSGELMNRMVLKSDPSASIIKKLGTGKARLGLAINIDALKYDHFLNDFYPGLMSELSKVNMQLQMVMTTLGENVISGLWNGKFGIVMVGDAIKDGSFVPEVNLHFGLGSKGKVLADMLSAFTQSMPKNPDGSTSFNGMSFKISEQEINACSEKSKSTHKSLELPDFAKNFGKSGMSFFLDLDGLDMKSLDVDDGGKFILAIKNIYMEGDNDKCRIVINGKKSDQNILKQVLDVYIEDIKQKVEMLN